MRVESCVKSTSELGCWNFHAIEQTQPRRKYRVGGVGRPKFDSTQMPRDAATNCMSCTSGRGASTTARAAARAREERELDAMNIRALLDVLERRPASPRAAASSATIS